MASNHTPNPKLSFSGTFSTTLTHSATESLTATMRSAPQRKYLQDVKSDCPVVEACAKFLRFTAHGPDDQKLRTRPCSVTA